MKLKELLAKVADEPVFRAGFLAASGESLPSLRLQLTRWVKAGKVIQLTKGLYMLAEPYRKVTPHPFVLANAMKKGSYVSLQSALAHFGMIPEHVPTVTSVTTKRPERIETPAGLHVFRHIKRGWFRDYEALDLGPRQRAFVATPEKALLDLVYLTAGSDNSDFLTELRLQNCGRLNPNRLVELAEMNGSPKLRRASRLLVQLISEDAEETL
jgi:AbiEi antitoxin C-terminal domain